MKLDFDASSGGQYTSFSFDAVDSVYTGCGQGVDVVAQWTAPRSGYYSFSTEGTEYPATLALFTGGTNCDAPEACGYGQFGGQSAYVEHYVTEGETYLIVLESQDVGRFVVNVTPIDSPQCTPVQLDPGGDFEIAGNYLAEAVPNNGINGACGGHARAVPFSFVAPCKGWFTFDSTYSDFDTVLSSTGDNCTHGVLNCPEPDQPSRVEDMWLEANEELVLFLAAAANVEPNANLIFRLRVSEPECFIQ